MSLAPNGGDNPPQAPGPGGPDNIIVIVCNTVVAGLTSLYVTTHSITVVVIAAALSAALAVLIVFSRRR